MHALLLVTATLAALSGCAGAGNAARTQVVSLVSSATATRETADLWNAWADTHLCDGDIVFMRGDCYMLLGTVNFSDVCADLTDSRFSHIGLVAVEDGQAYVYDIRNKGCLRTRFGALITDRQLHQLAIKRHSEASADAMARAALFCRNAYWNREKYDDELKLNNDRMYCTELVEDAYRTAGYTLSEPVAIEDFPNCERHRKTLQFVRAVTSIELDQKVLLPGNDRYGIWSNRSLHLILDLEDTRTPPSSD
jgi:hypothetical protein